MGATFVIAVSEDLRTIRNVETGEEASVDEYDIEDARDLRGEWPLRDTVALLYGSWVCEYPEDLLGPDDVFYEAVELREDGHYDLIVRC